MTSALNRCGAPLILALVACGTDATAPATGTLEVRVTTSGEGSDPDGYVVVVNRSVERPVPPDGSVAIEALPPGESQVLLQGLAFNCSVGEGTRVVSLVAGDTARAAFEVACLRVTGTLRVAVSTSGADPDPSGYTLTLDDTPSARTEPIGISQVSVGAGSHTVSLTGLTANCEIAEPGVLQVDVPARGEVDLAFEVRCTAAQPFGPGREIAYQSVDAASGLTILYSVNEDGTHPVRLFPEIGDSLITPAWAPDGVRLGFYSLPREGEAILHVADPSGGAPTELPVDRGSVLLPELSWSPDGTRVLVPPDFSQGCPALRLLRIDGSGSDLLPLGCSYEDLRSPSWSPDGLRIAFIGTNSLQGLGEFRDPAFVELARPGETAEIEGCGSGALDVVWSPDGSKLAFGGDNILVLELNTGVCTQITEGQGSDRSPSWSPDGHRLAFSSTRDGNAEIYVVDAAGGGNPTRISRSPASDGTPSWRP